jgi:hypothetical protein
VTLKASVTCRLISSQGIDQSIKLENVNFIAGTQKKFNWSFVAPTFNAGWSPHPPVSAVAPATSAALLLASDLRSAAAVGGLSLLFLTAQSGVAGMSLAAARDSD